MAGPLTCNRTFVLCATMLALLAGWLAGWWRRPRALVPPGGRQKQRGASQKRGVSHGAKTGWENGFPFVAPPKPAFLTRKNFREDQTARVWVTFFSGRPKRSRLALPDFQMDQTRAVWRSSFFRKTKREPFGVLFFSGGPNGSRLALPEFQMDQTRAVYRCRKRSRASASCRARERPRALSGQQCLVIFEADGDQEGVRAQRAERHVVEEFAAAADESDFLPHLPMVHHLLEMGQEHHAAADAVGIGA